MLRYVTDIDNPILDLKTRAASDRHKQYSEAYCSDTRISGISCLTPAPPVSLTCWRSSSERDRKAKETNDFVTKQRQIP